MNTTHYKIPVPTPEDLTNDDVIFPIPTWGVVGGVVTANYTPQGLLLEAEMSGSQVILGIGSALLPTQAHGGVHSAFVSYDTLALAQSCLPPNTPVLTVLKDGKPLSIVSFCYHGKVFEQSSPPGFEDLVDILYGNADTALDLLLDAMHPENYEDGEFDQVLAYIVGVGAYMTLQNIPPHEVPTGFEDTLLGLKAALDEHQAFLAPKVSEHLQKIGERLDVVLTLWGPLELTKALYWVDVAVALDCLLENPWVSVDPKALVKGQVFMVATIAKHKDALTDARVWLKHLDKALEPKHNAMTKLLLKVVGQEGL